VSLRDATANLIVLDAIREAAACGNRIEVDLSSLNEPPTAVFYNGIAK
jgi:hypothetical protein